MREFLWVVALAVPAAAQDWFAGGFVGVSTLSGDARAEVTGAAAAGLSQYKPENGLTVMGFFGRHANDYLSFQASHGWNGNDVTLLSAALGSGGQLIEQPYRARMHSLLGEGMLYFRDRRNWVRPYLSAGAGVAHLRAALRDGTRQIGSLLPAPARFSSTGLAFRAAVGIDLRLSGSLSFRYSFSETIQGNGLSRRLNPPGQRNLANFQNLFGLVWRF